MKITKKQSADCFDLTELHTLATDPDFQIKINHAKKLGVQSFDRVNTILQEEPLSDASIKMLFAHTREQVLWLLGTGSPVNARLVREVSDDKLNYIAEAGRSFREPMQSLIAGVLSLCSNAEKDKLNTLVAALVNNSNGEKDAAAKLFRVLEEVIIPKWEQKAALDIRTRSSYYANQASQNEINYFGNVPYDHFAKGQTARWIDKVIEKPAKHGLKHGSLSGTLAVQNLQTALLCDVICHAKEISAELLPETLMLDVSHLLKLQSRFKQLLEAQCVTDFYGALSGQNRNKEEVFKTILFALQNGDESYGLNLPVAKLEHLKALTKDKKSPAANLHRERLRELLIGGVDRGIINRELIKKWHYEGMLDELNSFNEHINRILQVHFPVFVNVYYNLLETHLDDAIWTSLFSLDSNKQWQDWLANDNQAEAIGIRGDFKSLSARLAPLVLPHMRAAIAPRMQRCLVNNEGWDDLNALFVVHAGGDFGKIKQDMDALFYRVFAFRTLLQQKRLQKCEEEKGRMMPRALRSGLRRV